MTVTATPVSSTDAFLANYVAIEERRANFEEKLANQQLRKDTMEEIKTFGNMLMNPLPRATYRRSHQGVSGDHVCLGHCEVEEDGFASAASSAGAAGGGFITPTKGPGQALSEHDKPGGSASIPESCCSK